MSLRESSIYQEIYQEGWGEGYLQGQIKGYGQAWLEESAFVLLRYGTRRWGDPTAEVKAAVQAIADLGGFHRLIDRRLEASSWFDWLCPPGANHQTGADAIG